MIDTILSYIAPHSCCSCGELGALLCESCKNDIIHESFERCIGCLKPTRDAICSRCRKTYGVQDVFCLGSRDGALKATLDAYKFRSSREAVKHLVDMMDVSMPLINTTATVTAAPTSAAHTRVRGFDHAKLCAKQFATRRSLPYRTLLETTSRDIQHLKTRSERFKAAEKSIRVCAPTPEHVLLIDDIMTTGATILACSQRLREAGVKRVDVAIIARQMPHKEK